MVADTDYASSVEESSSDHDFEHDTQQDSSEMEEEEMLIDVEDEQHNIEEKEEEEDEQEEGEILPSHSVPQLSPASVQRVQQAVHNELSSRMNSARRATYLSYGFSDNDYQAMVEAEENGENDDDSV